MHTHPTLCRHPAALAYRSCGSTTPSVNKTYHGRRSTTSCSHCLYVDRVARGQIHGAHRGSFNVLYKDASLVNLRVLIQLTEPLHRLNRMDLDRRERLAPCADSSGPVSGREQLRRRPFPLSNPVSRPLSPALSLLVAAFGARASRQKRQRMRNMCPAPRGNAGRRRRVPQAAKPAAAPAPDDGPVGAADDGAAGPRPSRSPSPSPPTQQVQQQAFK